jgi:hypothetical protein
MEKIYQTLICGVRCNVTREPGGYVVRRVTENGKSHTVLARHAETEAGTIAIAKAFLEASARRDTETDQGDD